MLPVQQKYTSCIKYKNEIWHQINKHVFVSTKPDRDCREGHDVTPWLHNDFLWENSICNCNVQILSTKRLLIMSLVCIISIAFPSNYGSSSVQVFCKYLGKAPCRQRCPIFSWSHICYILKILHICRWVISISPSEMYLFNFITPDRPST